MKLGYNVAFIILELCTPSGDQECKGGVGPFTVILKTHSQ